jgi:hypothetical protein
MAKIGRLFLGAFFIFVMGGGLYLANWDIPPPTTRVERSLPDSRFPR